MEQMVTISVKIPIGLKNRIKKSRIKLSTIVRNLLEKEMLEEEAHKLDQEIKRHKKTLDKLSVEQVVKDIREDRYKAH